MPLTASPALKEHECSSLLTDGIWPNEWLLRNWWWNLLIYKELDIQRGRDW